MSVLLLLLGIVGLILGSDRAVQAAERLAARMNVSSLVIGLTLTSIGTSLPEIATNLAVGFNAASGGPDASGLAVGNVIGSCLSQITLLLGVSAMVMPLKVPGQALKRDGMMALGALFVMFAVCANGVVSRVEGAACVVAYGIYVAWLLLGVREERDDDEPIQIDASIPIDVLQVLVGLGLVVFCADLVVDQGVAMARSFGLAESVVGVLVGLGTGLPELTVALGAARLGDSGLALGNLIGSNITDPLLSFGAGAAVHQVLVPADSLRIDFAWWFIGTVVAMLLMHTSAELDRFEGGVLVVLFVLYGYTRLFA